MKKALIILVLGLIANACEQNICDHSISLEHLKIKTDSSNKRPEKLSHSFIESDCNLINEWLNRKSMGSFINNHITLESTIDQIMDNTYINDKFKP